MIEFEITYNSTRSFDWPKINILHNNILIGQKTCDQTKFMFRIDTQEKNIIKLDWFNKTQKHTITEGDKIIKDQTFELCNVRVDNIQIENWFLTEGLYFPRYFKGYIEQHAQSRINTPLDKVIKSQLIWHFPGTFTFMEFDKDFWNWYFKLKQDKEVIKFLDKDPERVHKFRGSLDPCDDLVQKIKELI